MNLPTPRRHHHQILHALPNLHEWGTMSYWMALDPYLKIDSYSLWKSTNMSVVKLALTHLFWNILCQRRLVPHLRNQKGYRFYVATINVDFYLVTTAMRDWIVVIISFKLCQVLYFSMTHQFSIFSFWIDFHFAKRLLMFWFTRELNMPITHFCVVAFRRRTIETPQIPILS